MKTLIEHLDCALTIDRAALKVEDRPRAAAIAERAGLSKAGVPTKTTPYD